MKGMKYHIAVIEDDELIRSTIQYNLEKNGYRVDAYESIDGIEQSIRTQHFNLLVLDIVLHEKSGLELLKQIRDQRIMTPVLMISVKADMTSKLTALNTGADDYLVKPFNMDELIARVNAIIRRNYKIRDQREDRIRIGDYLIDLSTRTCQSQFGEQILSEKEIQLLGFFSRNRNRILSRSDILEEVWGMDSDPTPRTIDNFIVKFRKLFEPDPAKPTLFITVRSKGYLFKIAETS